MSLILSLETSTQVCSVALHQQGQLISTIEVHQENAHASRLAVIIDRLFFEAAIQPSQLNAVAISSGPGSYTGLRIGTSTAKGLCYALSIPLLSADTLEILAYQFSKEVNFNGWLCPMLDARRYEVYCRLVGTSGAGSQSLQAKIIESTSFHTELEKTPIAFFGNGAAKCSEIIRHPNAHFFSGFYPQAAALGELAFVKWSKQQTENLTAFEPHYLKEFVAKTPRTIF